MANEQLRKFARELKEAREKKGLSIKDLHNQTRIDTKYLEALEEGNYSVLPEVYIRAFIREFAAEVNLDVNEMLKKYELAKSGVNFEEADNTEENTEQTKEFSHAKTDFGNEQPKTEPADNKKQNYTLIYSVFGAIIIVLLVYFIFVGNGDDEIIIENKYEVPRTEQKTTPNIQKEKTEDIKVKEKQVTEPRQSVVPQNPFSLKLTGIDTAWIRAKIDDDRTEEFTLYPEISRTIEVKGIINLLIGNSAGVEIFIDDKKIDFEGEKGKVRNIVLSKNGIVKKTQKN